MNSKKGLVIRTAFNNQDWAGKCKKPLDDPSCFKCQEGKLFINHGNPVGEDEHGYCRGNPENYPLNHPLDKEQPHWCWEQVLCKRFFWGNVRGKWRSAYPDMPVYFVYPEKNGTLTLWGESTIERIDNEPNQYPPIFFKPFKPLPKDKWIKGLRGQEITGNKWAQGNFRYLEEKHQKYLASLIEGGNRDDTISQRRHESITIELRRDIREQLERIAETEGRNLVDLIREAIAKLIRERS